jgi:hypothetical protein
MPVHIQGLPNPAFDVAQGRALVDSQRDLVRAGWAAVGIGMDQAKIEIQNALRRALIWHTVARAPTPAIGRTCTGRSCAGHRVMTCAELAACDRKMGELEWEQLRITTKYQHQNKKTHKSQWG